MDLKNIVAEWESLFNIRIDEETVRAHVMRPENVVGVISDPWVTGIHRPEVGYAFKFGLLYHLDVAAFGDTLDSALKDQVAGYVVRLQQGNHAIYTRAWNWAQTAADASESWTADVRMHVASCSKLITAMAMTRVLNERKISYDTPIIGSLPVYWAKGPNIDKITFRHLLTHTSGFENGTNSASDYEFMKSRVAAGVTGVGAFKYENMNFGLCRILLATVVGDIPPTITFPLPFIANANDVIWDIVTINSYVGFVQNHVFTPSGVSGPTLDHPSSDALAYNSPTNGKGWDSGNLRTMAGGAGWHLSVDDLLRIMRAFRRQGVIVSAADAQAMLDEGFGIDAATASPKGTLYYKKGYWQDASKMKVEQSLAYFLPNDMELVLLVNSPVGASGQAIESIVTEAYLSSLTMRDSLSVLRA
jgi:CubicO group peptidase (beta-lactamase class C family)